MKTSKVKAVQPNGTFESQYGVPLTDDPNGKKGFFKFEYEFEDGTILTANHKSKNSFQVGELVEYEITKSTDYGNLGKVSKPKEEYKGKPQDLKRIKIGHAINNAVHLQVAEGVFEDKDGFRESDLKTSIKLYAKMIYSISEELNNEI